LEQLKKIENLDFFLDHNSKNYLILKKRFRLTDEVPYRTHHLYFEIPYVIIRATIREYQLPEMYIIAKSMCSDFVGVVLFE